MAKRHTSKSLKNAGIQPGRPNVRPRSLESSYENRGMYSTIVLENFRGFENIQLDDLGTINLLFGPNNSGKTSILEAIYAHASGLNFQPFFGNVVLRRQDQILSGALDMGDKIKSLFHSSSKIPYQFSITGQLQEDRRKQSLNVIFRPSAQLTDLDPRAFGQYGGGVLATRPGGAPSQANFWDLGSRGARLRTAEMPAVFIGQWTAIMSDTRKDWEINFPVSNIPSELPFKLGAFHDILAHRQPEADLRVFSYLKRYELISEFVETMAEVFPGIRGIDIIPYPDGTQGPVYVRGTDDRVVPLYAYGDGMRRWFYLLGNMLVYKGAVHCIEESDSTMHPSSQAQFCRRLAEFATRFKNQIFLTSHNIEFADAFLQALFGEGGTYAGTTLDPVRVYTVHLQGGRAEIWPLRGREAFEKRGDFGLELRG